MKTNKKTRNRMKNTMSLNNASSFRNNPFFSHEMQEVCAICNKQLEPTKTQSLFAPVPKLRPTISAFQVLQTLSDFNIQNGPQNVCLTCFHNITTAYRFQLMCNKAHEKIQSFLNYQEEIERKNHENAELEKEIEREYEPNKQIQMVNDVTGEIIIYSIVGVKELVETKSESHNTLQQTEKKVRCKVCHKMYQVNYLPDHMNTHTGNRPYTCTICSKSFANSTTLKLHSATHSDLRKYVCKFCGSTFKLLRHLRGHERIHTGEKIYKCTFCEMSFQTSFTRKCHIMKMHTKERPHQCEMCAKTFMRSSNLKRHMQTHFDVKAHECHLCGNQFTQAYSLKCHLKRSCRRLTDP